MGDVLFTFDVAAAPPTVRRQVMAQLKRHVETGVAAPVFVNS